MLYKVPDPPKAGKSATRKPLAVHPGHETANDNDYMLNALVGKKRRTGGNGR